MELKKSLRLGIVAGAFLLSGCQTKDLRITPFGNGGEGAPYALRFTQYDVTIKWRVTSCGRRTARAGEAVNDVPTQPFTVLAEVVAEPSFPEDPERRWLLDLSSLNGWINSTDLSVSYEGGKFKSFNASVEDKTADTVTAVAGAVGKVVALGVMVGAGPTADPCADFVETARLTKEQTEKDTAALARAKTDLATAQAQGASQASIQRLEAKVRLSADQLAASAAALEKALKVVSYEQKLKWPQRGSDGPSTRIALPPEAIARWQAARWSEAGKIGVLLDLKVVDANGAMVAVPQEDLSTIAAKTQAGRIPVRVARPGVLVSSLAVPVVGGPEKVEELGRKESTVIQSGDIIYVPVTYRWPRSSTAGFGLDANGYLASVTHKQTGAPAQTIAKSVDAIAEQADKLVKTDLEKLKEENDLLTARKSNAELRAALNPKPASPEKLELDAIQAELTLKRAQFELALIERWMAAMGATP